MVTARRPHKDEVQMAQGHRPNRTCRGDQGKSPDRRPCLEASLKLAACLAEKSQPERRRWQDLLVLLDHLGTPAAHMGAPRLICDLIGLLVQSK